MSETILQAAPKPEKHADVLRLADIDMAPVAALLARYGLSIKTLSQGKEIPGSYWGDEEAGLIGNELLVRTDTPLHSILHEACHYVCMDKTRREGLDTDAGGDYDEENTVCYLQILLAEQIEPFGRERMLADMDRWGYTFRLGSARAWFERDANETRDDLHSLGLTDKHDQPTFKLREF